MKQGVYIADYSYKMVVLKWMLILRAAIITATLLVPIVLTSDNIYDQFTLKVIVIGTYILTALYWYINRFYKLSNVLFGIQTTFDIVLITIIIYYTGGYTSPFVGLYFLSIVCASLFTQKIIAFSFTTQAVVFNFFGSMMGDFVSSEIQSSIITQNVLYSIVLYTVFFLSSFYADKLRSKEAALSDALKQLKETRQDLSDIINHTHILVINEEKQIRDILHSAIANEGYKCSNVVNAREALQLIKKNDVDVIINDVALSEASGLDFVGIVKENYNADVMVLTEFSEGIKYEEIIEKGACDFIQKPVSPKELLVRLQRVVKERTILSERNQVEEELRNSYKKLQNVLKQTVVALSSTLEQRDPYTSGHQQRVSKLACTIAKEIGFSDNQIEGVQMAGLLHDIGKISIPIDILTKPTKINESEFNLIKEHPRNGFNILHEIEFEQPIAQIVYQHHEKLNGSGYPRRLIDKDIILEARILTVADVVEAMVSHRPYRPALGKKKALDEIIKNRGVLYDQKIVDITLNLIKNKGFAF
ncbi:HD domain-containing phosphohydrolase [Candidatus Latescibacterota bacterium]